MEQNGLSGDSGLVVSEDGHHDYVELIERKVLRRVMNRKEGRKRGKDKERKKRNEKVFHSLRITPPVHTDTTGAFECGHLPHQVQPLKCYFQHSLLKIFDAEVMIEGEGFTQWSGTA